MGMRNKRKYICLDCGKATYFSKRERNSRFRIQCRHCGSHALDPSERSLVKEEILKLNENRLLGQPPHSIVKQKYKERKSTEE